ncbi:ERF family protein [Desulfoplanes sp. PS50]
MTEYNQNTAISHECQSPVISNLAMALSRVQGAMEFAKKDSVNASYSSHYSSLAACLDSCRIQLADNDLAVIQIIRTGNDGVMHLLTRLIHARSGEWIESDYPIFCQIDNPQAVGSALTYARRYSLCAIIGIASEDDDGEHAIHYNDKGGNSGCKTDSKPGKAGDAVATHKQIETIEEMARERGLDALEAVGKFFEKKVDAIERLSRVEASRVITWMSQHQARENLEKAV